MHVYTLLLGVAYYLFWLLVALGVVLVILAVLGKLQPTPCHVMGMYVCMYACEACGLLWISMPY